MSAGQSGIPISKAMQACSSRWEGCAGITVQYTVKLDSVIRTTQLCTAKNKELQESGTLLSSWEYSSVDYLYGGRVSKTSYVEGKAMLLSSSSMSFSIVGQEVSLTPDDELYNAVAIKGFVWDELSTTFTKSTTLIPHKIVWIDVMAKYIMFKCTKLASRRFNRWIIGDFKNLNEYIEGTSCSAFCWKANNGSLTLTTKWEQMTDYPTFQLNKTVITDVQLSFYQRGQISVRL